MMRATGKAGNRKQGWEMTLYEQRARERLGTHRELVYNHHQGRLATHGDLVHKNRLSCLHLPLVLLHSSPHFRIAAT